MLKEKEEKYIEFARYFRKICKNEELFSWGLEYFSYLQNINYNLSKDNLDKLNFNHKIYEQDIIKELFKKRNEVSIDEVFLYQFKKTIKKIVLMDSISKKTDKYVVLGRVDTAKKLLMVSDFEIYTKKLKEYFYPTPNMPRYITSQELKNNFNIVSRKMTFFHELSHILQHKHYGNSQFVEVGTSSSFNDLKNKKYYTLDICNNKELVKYHSIGNNLLNEIFNEYFTGAISNKTSIENNKTSPNNYLHTKNEEKYSYFLKEKNYLDIHNAYFAELGAFLPFLSSLLNDINIFEYNLKSKQIKNIINSYIASPNIRKKIDDYLPIVFANYTITTSKNKKENEDIDFDDLVEEYQKEITKLSNSEIINLLLYARYNHSTKLPFYYNKNYFEAFALNLYRSKIKQEFENEKVEKNGNYFQKINQNLIEMYKFIYGKWDENVEFRDLKTGEKKIAPLDKVASIENLVQLYPKNIQFEEFNFLLNDLDKYIKKLSPNEQKLAYKNLGFLQKQKEINQNYFVIKKINNKNPIKLKINSELQK